MAIHSQSRSRRPSLSRVMMKFLLYITLLAVFLLVRPSAASTYEDDYFYDCQEQFSVRLEASYPNNQVPTCTDEEFEGIIGMVHSIVEQDYIASMLGVTMDQFLNGWQSFATNTEVVSPEEAVAVPVEEIVENLSIDDIIRDIALEGCGIEDLKCEGLEEDEEEFDFSPTVAPTVSASPSSVPTISNAPSVSKTPSTSPSLSNQPSDSPAPSAVPSASPSDVPSGLPSLSPSALPSSSPSAKPSHLPSISQSPSAKPSSLPSISLSPSDVPSDQPSRSPSQSPTLVASDIPSFSPSHSPSVVASESPSATPSSGSPSQSPSVTASDSPTVADSDSPSASPSQLPSSDSPSQVPSAVPSSDPPSQSPSATPSSDSPSQSPSNTPSSDSPSQSPSNSPSSNSPSRSPSKTPSSSSDSPSQSPSSDSPSASPTDPTRRGLLLEVLIQAGSYDDTAVPRHFLDWTPINRLKDTSQGQGQGQGQRHLQRIDHCPTADSCARNAFWCCVFCTSPLCQKRQRERRLGDNCRIVRTKGEKKLSRRQRKKIKRFERRVSRKITQELRGLARSGNQVEPRMYACLGRPWKLQATFDRHYFEEVCDT